MVTTTTAQAILFCPGLMGPLQSPGAIRAVDAYKDNIWYSACIERNESAYVLSVSGNFKWGDSRRMSELYRCGLCTRRAREFLTSSCLAIPQQLLPRFGLLRRHQAGGLARVLIVPGTPTPSKVGQSLLNRLVRSGLQCCRGWESSFEGRLWGRGSVKGVVFCGGRW
jgi:hypothetical protein